MIPSHLLREKKTKLGNNLFPNDTTPYHDQLSHNSSVQTTPSKCTSLPENFNVIQSSQEVFCTPRNMCMKNEITSEVSCSRTPLSDITNVPSSTPHSATKSRSNKSLNQHVLIQENNFMIPSNCRVIRSNNQAASKSQTPNIVHNAITGTIIPSRSPLSYITNKDNNFMIPSNCRVIRSNNQAATMSETPNIIDNAMTGTIIPSRSPLSHITNNVIHTPSTTLGVSHERVPSQFVPAFPMKQSTAATVSNNSHVVQPPFICHPAYPKRKHFNSKDIPLFV